MRRCKFHVASLLLRVVGVQLIILSDLASTTAAIRKKIGFQGSSSCRTTVQGRYLLSDNNGRVCTALSLDRLTRCCPEQEERFSCLGCCLQTQCCNSYEYCVSCCLNPAKTQEQDVMLVKRAKASTAGTYNNVFDYCSGRCLHNSNSVVHENAYISDFHHCFSLPSNTSAANDTQPESRLNGIKVVVGRQGESCDSVCKLHGQTCVVNKLSVLNECGILQRYMRCKGACLSSIGSDQPAEVVDDAPTHLNPGACLFSGNQAVLSCEGSHRHTRRLCPCA